MTSVPALFESVEESMRETLRRQDVSLHIQCEFDSLCMDEDLMRSLLINLLDNAAKASCPGQAITLRAYDNIIEVTDHGAGIPPQEIGRVTEPFYMVDRSRSKAKGGSGLGLALVKAIADAHDAEMHITSTLEKGTTVQICFPKTNC
jgi:two-component system phosphate regulon sensor histidine kinase PhoR